MCSQYSSAVCKLEANYRQVFVSASCSKTPASLCSLSAQTLAKMYLSKLINLFLQRENVFFPNCKNAHAVQCLLFDQVTIKKGNRTILKKKLEADLKIISA